MQRAEKNSQDLTGQWSGTFSYPDGIEPSTPFEAIIEDQGGHLSGKIIEPSHTDGRTLEATLIGTRHGSSCDFIKTYTSDAPGDYDQPVDYVGGIGPDGLTINGVWSLLDFDGKFEMHRDQSAQKTAELSVEAEERLPVD